MFFLPSSSKGSEWVGLMQTFPTLLVISYSLFKGFLEPGVKENEAKIPFLMVSGVSLETTYFVAANPEKGEV